MSENKMILRESSFMSINEDPKKKDAKTSTFSIFTKDGCFYLGKIKWQPTWRKYAFFPGNNNTLFDAACLLDIVAWLNDLMLYRKVSMQMYKQSKK